jgi:chorismate mutase/prephenate dehydratase
MRGAAMPESKAANPALLALRDRIDALDRELLSLLNRRMQVVVEVGELKKHEGSPVFRPSARRRSSTA